MNGDLIFILITLMDACRTKGELITETDIICIKVDRIIKCTSSQCPNCLLGYKNLQIYPRLIISRWINEL